MKTRYKVAPQQEQSVGVQLSRSPTIITMRPKTLSNIAALALLLSKNKMKQLRLHFTLSIYIILKQSYMPAQLPTRTMSETIF